MGTLDPIASSTTQEVSKVLSVHGMSRPQTKTELDSYLQKGWRLITVFVTASGNDTRAILVRDKE